MEPADAPEPHDTQPITDLLLAARHGDARAMTQLIPLVYGELRRMAHQILRHEHPDHTLGTTGLVHEAYLKLVDDTRIEWQDRAHFFAVAARAMRQILVDYARRLRAGKRGGGRVRVDVDVSQLGAEDRAETILALEEALARLEAVDGRLSQVVECRFFAGLTEDETAQIIGVTSRTIRRDWLKAKAWLYRELSA
jgi:RNA polymerase sigma factor (TIGR02999 family)